MVRNILRPSKKKLSIETSAKVFGMTPDQFLMYQAKKEIFANAPKTLDESQASSHSETVDSAKLRRSIYASETPNKATNELMIGVKRTISNLHGVAKKESQKSTVRKNLEKC